MADVGCGLGVGQALERAEPTETELQPVFNLLDLILSFSERGKLPLLALLRGRALADWWFDGVWPCLDYADSALPLVCLTSLLEIETIQTCQHLFNYIELRRDRITKVSAHLPGSRPPPLAR